HCRPPAPTLFPYTTLFRSQAAANAWGYAWTGFQNAAAAFQSALEDKDGNRAAAVALVRQLTKKIQSNPDVTDVQRAALGITIAKDRKSTRLNSSHVEISYA